MLLLSNKYMRRFLDFLLANLTCIVSIHILLVVLFPFYSIL